MSPRKAGKPTDAATHARGAAHSPPTPGGDHARVQDGDGSDDARATHPHGPRSGRPPGVGRSRNTDPAPFDDSSNYLG